jgi:hypothetical protein
MIKMEIAMSKFMNGNKKADVVKTDNGYAVNMYLDDKFLQKRIMINIDDAEALAEDFVLEEGESGPKFLSEDA